MTNEQYDDFIISAFEDFFIAAVAPETVACVVMELGSGRRRLHHSFKTFRAARRRFL